ncbi:MAG: AarF/ABC1/UbiB kinase family protein [Actinomycetota bacterium]|nr:AarF/ABC1/UbiB kinase family protein [Actinomycetota bacterium]
MALPLPGEGPTRALRHPAGPSSSRAWGTRPRARLPWRKAAPFVAAGAATLGAGVGVVLADEHRRNRVERQIRMYRLSVRRLFHWAVVRVQGRAATEEQRARLEESFAIRSAQDVAEVLGNMKGAIMKAGQMVSFIAEGLPPEAQAALATLQADVPPMAPSLAEEVIRQELGADPEKLFLDWDPMPKAAASIGQVHKAVMPDGRLVAVKVQYPGVDKAIKSDLDNAQLLYGMFAAFALRNMDVKAMVDELRQRMGDELDYHKEARFQAEFAHRYRGHPFIHVPDIVPERSAKRVITSEWVDGLSWAEFLETANQHQKDTAAEILFRFAEGSIWNHRVFNGDPHPGNYRFHPKKGKVTFLDFGLVKRWSPGELETLSPILEAILGQDPRELVRALTKAGFLAPDNDISDERVYEYCSGPYIPFQVDEFTYTSEFVGKTLQRMLDMGGEYGDLIKSLNMPPSYVILDRVVWGMSALFGKMRATNQWKNLLAEYFQGAPPCTELGRVEAEWRAEKRATTAGS